MNQDLIFNRGLLKFISNGAQRRLLALSNRFPHYSDDDGFSWEASSGIPINDSWGNCRFITVLDDEQQHIYLLSKPDYWSDISLYKSIDRGETFEQLQTFPSNNFDRYALCKPHHSNSIFLMERASDGVAKLFELDTETDELIALNSSDPLHLEEARANVVAWSSESTTLFYSYNRTYDADLETWMTQAFKSENMGETWETLGTLHSYPWEVGMYVMPSNPDVLFYGEVNAYKSEDGAESWEEVNDWSEYYGNECCQLHADMMHFAEFEDHSGTNFQLISHHGGLSYSEDYLQNQNNISLYGLNVSQYYSVRTDPLEVDYVYAGSQDQGFQRSATFENGDVAEFDQIISGDYGHIIFTNNQQSLWAVYPGGWLIYYEEPQTGSIEAHYTIDSEHETVWLPPMMASPNSSDNICYVAGGSIDEGPGSYILKLEVQEDDLQVSQLPFDFRAESSGGTISALAASSVDHTKWYAATTNGRFFYSSDSGQSWDQTINFIPDGNYLYGQAIYASRLDENTVYLGGSGYSNPPLFKSENGGESFSSMSDGLPATLVYGITANADESRIFAATEAGPYVYLAEDNRWYDLSGQCAPTQIYWSVEFIESLNTVRFGTYGRGIWDFNVDETVASEEVEFGADFQLFPNPSTGLVYIKSELFDNDEALLLEVYTLTGQLILRQNNQSGSFDLSALPSGAYMIKARKDSAELIQKLILQ